MYLHEISEVTKWSIYKNDHILDINIRKIRNLMLRPTCENPANNIQWRILYLTVWILICLFISYFFKK